MTLLHSRTGLFARVRRMWSEFDYANRRVFELQTGVSARRRVSIWDLEALYAAS